VWGAVAGSGGAAGVLLGGMLTEWAGWEWVLFVNVPIGIAAALLAPRLLPESRVEGHRHFDFAGAVSVTAGLSLLVYTLVNANHAGWGSAQTLIMIGIAVALLVAFVAIERKTKAPLVPFPGIFRMRSIRGINITALLIAMSLFSMFFFVSLYMQQVLGYSPLEAGLAYLPLAGGIIVAAGIASGMTTRFGVKPVLVSGLILIAFGLVWFAQISVGGSYVSDILGPSLVSAFGLGLAFVAMSVAGVAGVEHDEAGLASGLINTSQQVGGALGLAVLAAVADSRRDTVLETVHSMPTALTEGFHTALMVGAGFAITGAILALLLVSSSGAVPEGETSEVEAVPAPA
jgi:predicted MFS family arabinose efflux permease